MSRRVASCPGPKNIKISVTSLGSRDANRVTDKKWRGEQGGVLTVLRDPGALECYERVLVGLLDYVYRTFRANLSNTTIARHGICW